MRNATAAAFGLAALHWLIATNATVRKCVYFDEPAHLIAGYMYAKDRKFSQPFMRHIMAAHSWPPMQLSSPDVRGCSQANTGSTPRTVCCRKR